MATKSKPAETPTTNAKPSTGSKSKAPAKEAMGKETVSESASVANNETSVKKAPAKAAKKEAAPVVEPAKPAAKPKAVKKTEEVKEEAPVAPAKKAATKKVAEVVAEAPAKKEATKKETPAKKEAAKTEMPENKEVVKKAASAKKAEQAPKVEEEAKPAAPKKKEPVVKEVAKPEPAPVKKPAAKKEIPSKAIPAKPIPVAPRPMPTPAARSVEKKPGVVIAHRRLENKSKAPADPGNTMIQYLPETYRSILDEPQQQQGPVYRYSDEDLAEFRDIINSRLESARKELNYLQGLITRKDEAGTEDTENRYMNMEDGSGAMEREQLAQLASRQIQFMGHLEKALVRIENKTYGICRVTGKLIDKARLRAVPHATLSIEAKNTMSNKQNQ